jgi:hypothetical protein
MPDIIDVHDLPEDQVKLLQKFVEFLRGRAKSEVGPQAELKDVKFASWPLGATGALSRREIYDYL